jgi:hypothetical protein
MLKRHKAGERVPGGLYFNTHDWTMRVVPREGGALGGGDEARYCAFPTVMMLVAAPVLSFAFVIFLPFIGLALMAKAIVDRAATLLHAGRRAETDTPIRVTK